MLCCELVKLCHINRSGPVFRDTLYIQAQRCSGFFRLTLLALLSCITS